MTEADQPGKLGRLARLGGLTGRVTAKYLTQRARALVAGSEVGELARRASQLDSARDIVDTMGRLKGAAMKVGQQVAMFAETMDLPPEVASVLGALHAEAEAVPFDSIRSDLEAELALPIAEVFRTLDPVPLGTASLAQAHAATLPDGRRVVVKVLHRGVAGSVDTDLMALRGIMLSSRVIRRPREEIDRIFEELRDRLMEELDYLQEAANLASYQRLYADHPDLCMPATVPELCTERVLVMDRLAGVPIDAFVASATPEARQRAGETLARFYYEQVFRHRILHCDPHPGNYLFEPDGRVGVLDFGSVRRYDEFWIAGYARIALALLEDDRDAALAAAQDIGAWDGQNAKAGDALWAFISAMGGPFEGGAVIMGPGHENYLEEMRPAVLGILPHRGITAPKPLIMLHRSLAGMYALSRRIQARVDYAALVREHATFAVARAEGRTD